MSVGGGSDWEAESGECTVTVWTLDCGVSFVGRGRVVCFLFLEFHIMHILVHPRFTPHLLSFLCGCAFPFVHCVLTFLEEP